MRTRSRTWLPTVSLLVFLAPFAGSPAAAAHVGTDDQARELSLAMDPEYVPWNSPWWSPGSKTVETSLFCLQAASGLSILAFSIHQIRKGRKSTP